jgi:hypothetical protein
MNEIFLNALKSLKDDQALFIEDNGKDLILKIINPTEIPKVDGTIGLIGFYTIKIMEYVKYIELEFFPCDTERNKDFIFMIWKLNGLFYAMALLPEDNLSSLEEAANKFNLKLIKKESILPCISCWYMIK